jgi:general secretion pathway protein D
MSPRLSSKLGGVTPGLSRAMLLVLACAGVPAAMSAQGIEDAGGPALRATAKVTSGDADRAEQMYISGARLLDKQDLAGAQTAFEKAAKLNPRNPDYALAATLTRQHRVNELVQQAAKERMMSHPQQADALLAEAKAVDPASEQVMEHLAAADSAQTDGGLRTTLTHPHTPLYSTPIHLDAKTNTEDFDLRGNGRDVFETVGRAFGVKVDFDDSSGTQTMPPVRLAVQHVTYEQVMTILYEMTHSFGVAVDSKTVLVAHDSQENRAKLVRQVEETIYVPASTPEELNELTNIVKNVFDVKQVAIGQSSGTILVRAPEATLSALNETLDDMVDGAAEVVIEIKLISVEKSRVVNTGVSTPSSVGVFSVEQEASSLVSANQSLVQELISSGAFVPGANASQNIIEEALLLVLSGAVTDAKVASLVALAGNGLGLTGIYLGSGASINLDLTSSETKVLDDVTVRAGDRQTTTLKIGEKYPIETAIYSSGVSSSTSSALAGVSINGVSASTLLNQYLGSSSAAQSIPQFQFEDLGITLKTTPMVTRGGLVNLQIDLKIEALEGASLNTIPILSSQVYSSSITLPDGGSAVMLSDLTKTQSAAISGFPGFGDLPGFQETLANDDKDVDDSELLLIVTPHVVRHRKDLLASRRIPFESTVPAEY